MVQGAPKEVVNPSTGRASLLESIRQAGGIGKANLRSVKERKLEKKKQKEQEQGAGALLAGGSGVEGWGETGKPRARGVHRGGRRGWHSRAVVGEEVRSMTQDCRVYFFPSLYKDDVAERITPVLGSH